MSLNTTASLLFATLLLAPQAANAGSCSATLANDLKTRCSNAVDVSDNTAALVYCRQAAEEAGVCADESQGTSRANNLLLKSTEVYMIASAYMKQQRWQDALDAIEVANKALNGVVDTPGATDAQKAKARQNLLANKKMQRDLEAVIKASP
jgi:hypothetical protein